MGVSGCGKSTVGAALADALGGTFADGDDFHPEKNIRKMCSGTPLDDGDREPWLDRLNAWLHDASPPGAAPAVLACSALKAAYRERLARGLHPCAFLFLRVDPATLAARIQARPDHFMPPALLRSQLDTLEPPGAEALSLDADQPVDQIIAEAVRAFGFNVTPETPDSVRTAKAQTEETGGESNRPS